MTPEIFKGTIVQVAGSWGSGLAALTVDDERRGRVTLHSDNGPLVRSLDAAFGDVIGSGHAIDNRKGGHVGKTIFYFLDEFGLCLGGFVPEDDASPELIDAYERGGAE